jgi:hypothetical protein
MRQWRTEAEIDELIALARTYCSELSNYHYAQAEGRLSAEEDMQAQSRLARLDEKIELLKSNNELDRKRASSASRIISMARFQRKAAK